MFFDRFTNLCAQRGVSVARAAYEMGLSNSTTTKWSKGSVPSGKTLQTVAKYFNVSVDYLMGTAPKYVNRIKDVRIQSKMTPEDLAAAAGIDINALRRYEANEELPTPKTMKQVAGVLGVSAGSLLSGADLLTLVALENDLLVDFESGKKEPLIGLDDGLLWIDDYSKTKQDMIRLIASLSDEDIQKLNRIADIVLEK